MSFILKTPQDVAMEMAERAKTRRLAQNLSREGLARRAGISESSLKRFEVTGQISLESLTKIALVLEGLEEFENIFKPRKEFRGMLDDIIKETPRRQKGRLK